MVLLNDQTRRWSHPTHRLLENSNGIDFDRRVPVVDEVPTPVIHEATVNKFGKCIDPSRWEYQCVSTERTQPQPDCISEGTTPPAVEKETTATTRRTYQAFQVG